MREIHSAHQDLLVGEAVISERKFSTGHAALSTNKARSIGGIDFPLVYTLFKSTSSFTYIGRVEGQKYARLSTISCNCRSILLLICWPNRRFGTMYSGSSDLQISEVDQRAYSINTEV